MAICAITKYLPHCGGVVAKMFNTTNTTVYRIRHRLSNPWQTEKFDILPEEEQRALYDSLQEKFHLIEQKYANMTWRRTRRTLSKECVFIAFIYQEYKGKLGWKAQLSQDYNIANMNTLAAPFVMKPTQIIMKNINAFLSKINFHTCVIIWKHITENLLNCWKIL